LAVRPVDRHRPASSSTSATGFVHAHCFAAVVRSVRTPHTYEIQLDDREPTKALQFGAADSYPTFVTSCLGELLPMDVLVPDWSDWTALKVCAVKPSLVSSARVGQPSGLMRGAGFHAVPTTAISVLGTPHDDETEPQAAPVD
jgi:hypothetical protein